MWTCPPARIAVGVDFGPASRRALEAAVRVAAATGATLAAVHAETLEAPPYFTPVQIARIAQEQAQVRRQAADYLRTWAHQVTPHDVSVTVSTGPPADVLLRAAASADLLVLGTHGRRGPARWWLGSVAERVAHHSPVPVLVVHDQPVEAIFARPVLVDQGASPAVTACAAALAALDHGTLAHARPDDAAGEARLRGASVVIIPKVAAAAGAAAWYAAGLELVRSCRLPLLFVPEEDPS